MMSGTTTKVPFTASQWQELEQQALIFKHIASGVPIPPDLLLAVERSLEYSLSSRLIHHHYQAEWNCFQMGFGRKIDPEPGRCRRTDGKKWRCSKEAYQDSKYCERHIHRGRNRSRKPVAAATATANPSSSSFSAFSVSSSSMASETSHHFPFPHSSSSWRTPGYDLSSYDKGTAHLQLLDSSDIGLKPDSDYRYDDDSGMKKQIAETLELKPLAMSSDFCNKTAEIPQGLQQGWDFHVLGDDTEFGMSTNLRKDGDNSNKVMHQFLDPWPRNGDSWVDHQERDDYGPVSTTQLSISLPPVCHDFLMTRNGS